MITTSKGGSDTVNYKNFSLKIFTSWFIVLSLVLLSAVLSAYDGDVDYSAPYITVDPETGKLVTIDPKAQQQQHQATDPNTAQTANTQTDSGVQNSQVMGATGNSMNQSDEGQTSSATMSPLLIGILVLVFASVIIISARRSKPGSNVDSDTASGSDPS
jgi:hypothetical protein